MNLGEKFHGIRFSNAKRRPSGSLIDNCLRISFQFYLEFKQRPLQGMTFLAEKSMVV